MSFGFSLYTLVCLAVVVYFINKSIQKAKKLEKQNKKQKRTFKDGKVEGLHTKWYENGQKSSEVTYKDGEEIK
jgi:antitoxin component YwqK of YwqJK toxin-antitoxin module